MCRVHYRAVDIRAMAEDTSRHHRSRALCRRIPTRDTRTMTCTMARVIQRTPTRDSHSMTPLFAVDSFAKSTLSLWYVRYLIFCT